MYLKQTILLALAICSLIIGIHQTMTVGFLASYWLFMLTIGLLTWFRMDVSKRGIPKVQEYMKAKGMHVGTTKKEVPNKSKSSGTKRKKA